MDDPRPALTDALDQFARLVDALDPADLDRPTPCEGWAVRELVGHVLAVHRRLVAVAETGDSLGVPHVAEVADADLTAALATERRRIVELWADDAVLDRTAAVPFGTVPGSVAGWGLTQEVTVHAWDLATALGRVDELDDAVAATLEPVVRRMLPAGPREGMPFDPPVAVGDDAPPYVRLVAWLGRTP